MNDGRAAWNNTVNLAFLDVAKGDHHWPAHLSVRYRLRKTQARPRRDPKVPVALKNARKTWAMLDSRLGAQVRRFSLGSRGQIRCVR